MVNAVYKCEICIGIDEYYFNQRLIPVENF